MLTPNQTIIHRFTFNCRTYIFANEKHELVYQNISRCLLGESTDHETKVQAPKHVWLETNAG